MAVPGRHGGASLHTLMPARSPVPAPPSRLVRRGRLSAVLDAGDTDLACPPPVVVVTGPPGSGKTTLLAEWVSGADAGVVAWVTLEPGDGAAALWAPVLATAGAGRQGAGGTADTQAARAVRLLAGHDRPAWLVIDQAEHLRDRDAVHSLEVFLRWAPWPVRVLLAGRADPTIALHRLRLDGRLREVRGRDLAFTSAETAELLAGHGVRLGAADLALLHERTEGWAAGVRLAALALEGVAEPHTAIARFAGDDRTVADYLVAEVLARLPAGTGEFLLRTAVCDELTPELATELTGRRDAGLVLDDLVRANALTEQPVPAEPRYRYHTLLRSYLRGELRRRDAGTVRDVHRAASAWYAAAGDPLPAARHAVAAGDLADAAALVERHGVGLVLAGRGADLTRLVTRDAPALTARPGVLLATAVAALDAGDVPGADALLARVGEAEPGNPDADLRATLALTRARLAGDRPAQSAALAAVDGGGADRDVALLARAERGSSLLDLARPGDAERDLTAAVAVASADGRDPVALRCLTALAAVALARSDLEGAAERAGAALAFAGARGWDGEPRCAHAHVVAGLAAHLRGDDAGALGHARLAGRLLTSADVPTVRFAAATLEVLTEAGVGDDPHACAVRAAATWAEFAGVHLAPDVVAVAAPAHHRLCLRAGEHARAAAVEADVARRLGAGGESALLRAAALVGRGRVAAARRILDPVRTGDLACVSVGTWVGAWLLEAVLAAAAGDGVAAHHAVVRALGRAAHRRLVRPFVEVGRPLRPLLADGAGRFGHEDAFAALVLATIPADEPGATDVLTGREHAVLAALPSMRTAGEIAGDLYVSTNTVKTHLRSVYRKLGATNRRDAIHAARRAGLL
jgi:LuxR family transcriptional regulator, maltose regulon positive regulatory protein